MRKKQLLSITTILLLTLLLGPQVQIPHEPSGPEHRGREDEVVGGLLGLDGDLVLQLQPLNVVQPAIPQPSQQVPQQLKLRQLGDLAQRGFA